MSAGGRAGTAQAGSGGAAGTASAEYRPCPAVELCKILPLGDSITYGIGYEGGYRVELFQRAHAEGKSITFTGSLLNGPLTVDGANFPRNSEGHSGWKIDQLLTLLPSPALEPLPDIILLMIGTNDLGQHDAVADAPKRLATLLDRLATLAPDALVVVSTIIPLPSSNDVTAYNAAIMPIVQERSSAGRHLVLVDQFKDFPTSELGDGVHPNQAGYERMAGVWYASIRTLLH